MRPGASGQRSLTAYAVDAAYQLGPAGDNQLDVQDNVFYCVGAPAADRVPTGKCSIGGNACCSTAQCVAGGGDTCADQAPTYGGDAGKIHRDNGLFSTVANDNTYVACGGSLPITTLTRGVDADPTKPDPISVINPIPAVGRTADVHQSGHSGRRVLRAGRLQGGLRTRQRRELGRRMEHDVAPRLLPGAPANQRRRRHRREHDLEREQRVHPHRSHLRDGRRHAHDRARNRRPRRAGGVDRLAGPRHADHHAGLQAQRTGHRLESDRLYRPGRRQRPWLSRYGALRHEGERGDPDRPVGRCDPAEHRLRCDEHGGGGGPCEGAADRGSDGGVRERASTAAARSSSPGRTAATATTRIPGR